MLQNESVSDWLKLVKTNTTNTMQTIAQKRLNPNNYQLSEDAKKRLSWLSIMYYQEKGNISKTARKVGVSRQWLSDLKITFEKHRKDPRSLEPQSKAPRSTDNRIRIPKTTEELIIKIRDDSLNCWGKEKYLGY